MLKRLFLGLLLVGVAGCAQGRSEKPLRVLFIGNSYTYVNDLPGTIGHLASAAGFQLESVEECPGGFTLKKHWESGKDQPLLLGSHFDWVVMQDQSQEPSFTVGQLRRDMYPYVRQLQTVATQVGTRPILFMTWGHQNGDPVNVPGDTFQNMN
ncbi:MAG TPA: hypothetical protein VGO93_26555, partial [Candidatus Xenobia bacterium]